MKIAYIAAGAAGMYCGSCIHDNTLATALIRKGQEVTLIPTYTPLRTDEANVGLDTVFYGAINVYLQQKWSFLSRMPRFLNRILNRPSLLNWVARFGSATSPEDLGALTVSVLRGEEGRQKKELDRLVGWLETTIQPDLVQLTNSMFLGLSSELKRQLEIPVLCSLQGEDLFLESLLEPHKSEALRLLKDRAQIVNGFIAPCRNYADFMSGYLQVEREKVFEVPLGIRLSGHGERRDRKQGPLTIGYLARMCPEKGLHLLVEAFDLLVNRLGKENLRLEIAGYLGPRDETYFDQIQSRVMASPWKDCFKYWGEVDRQMKLKFLRGLDILSVPTVYKEPKGLFVLEALANRVPVVLPAHGSFPELIENTGGGRLVEPGSAEALADGLQFFVENGEERKRAGSDGQQAVREKYNDDVLAENALSVYRKFV